MTNKKFLVGMLAVLLSFGMMVIGCDSGGAGGDGDAQEPPPPPPPPATASVSISLTTNPIYDSGIRVYLSLYPSTAIWVGLGNQHYSSLNHYSQEYITKLFSWITVKDKDGESLGVLGDSNQNYDDKILYYSSDVALGSMLYLNILVGKNINLDDLKPITVTLNTEKLEEMKEYTNVTGSLTAGSKTSDTMEKK
jgi:hypothetical protein